MPGTTLPRAARLGLPVLLAGALLSCRRGPALPGPTDGLPGLEDLGYQLASSRFEDGFVADSASAGTVAFLVGMRGMLALDVSDPARPAVLSSVATTAPALQFNDVEVVDGRAYVTAGDRDGATGALIVFDVADPAHPAELSRFEFGSAAIGVSVAGGVAYVGGYSNGFEIIDVKDPRAPRRLANWRLPDPGAHTLNAGTAHVWWPAVRAPYAYVTYDGAGLHVLDVSDPAAPKLVGSFDKSTPNGLADCFFNEIALAGDRAYVAVDYCGMLVLDVSDPRNLREVAHVNPWNDAPWKDSLGHAIQVEVSGQRVFLSTSKDGVYVYDVQDPAKPRLTHARPASHAQGKGCAWGLTRTDSLLLIDYTICLPADGLTGGVEVFTARNP